MSWAAEIMANEDELEQLAGCPVQFEVVDYGWGVKCSIAGREGNVTVTQNLTISEAEELLREYARGAP